jgi:glycosyltransferase involved in cell wall biosynthesis
LLIVGSGEERKKLHARLHEEIAKGVVHIESDVPHHHLAGWYRAMDLFVLPSRYENYSNAALEALACGVPFLVSDVGGNRRLTETKGGWFFPSGTADALFNALGPIAGQPHFSIDRGAAGGENVRRRYSWETSAKRLEEILHSCVDKRIGVACSP